MRRIHVVGKQHRETTTSNNNNRTEQKKKSTNESGKATRDKDLKKKGDPGTRMTGSPSGNPLEVALSWSPFSQLTRRWPIVAINVASGWITTF